ncbi:MAG: class I SAM-dependent methyltransferase [Candidatus Diapherotrites archaeon]|nr:class I SAM-dependent methyltransferase [Candidatus Diapherotrites archaeon]
MKNGRVEYFRKNLRGKCLDLGCDFGRLHALIDKPEMVGLDIFNDNYMERVIRGNVLRMPLRGESFDTIVAGELIEHMPEPERLLAECKRVLRKGGALLISTPNRGAWSNRLFHRFDRASSKSEYPHQSVMNEKELRELSQRFFEVKDFRLMPYDEVSSPNQAGWVYAVRKAIHIIMPRGLREEMVVKLGKK